MRREDLKELHYIAFIKNVPSIWARGILSHTRTRSVDHLSWESGAQDRRRLKRVPNPALFLMIKDMGIPREKLCILRVSPAVLDIEGTVVTDMNAARCCRFERAPDGLAIVDAELTFAEWWADPDPAEKYRRKAYKCAEVLVPDRVSPEYLIGAYVSCSDARRSFSEVAPGLPSTVGERMFFL